MKPTNDLPRHPKYFKVSLFVVFFGMMPYIDLRDHHEGLIMMETIRNNFAGFTKK